MTTREDLEFVATEQQAHDKLVELRTATVAKARTEGMTWREIADILGMTQHGLIKAQQAHDKRTSRR